MRRFVWQSIAASSLLLTALAARGQTRPQYGGTLRVSVHEALNWVDPHDLASIDSLAKRNLIFLIFDTLVTMNESGRAQPALARSWQASRDNQRWRFQLRKDAHFHGGSPLTAEAVAASLQTVNPSWNISADGDSVVIERDKADPEMLAELALPRNAITKTNSDRIPNGTGPFRVVDWQTGKKLTLAANEDYWGGRPFLDAIEVEIGRSFHDQMTALEIGKSDLVEVPPEQARRASLGGREVASSAPIELVALVFSRDAQTPEEKLLRNALSLSIDRESMRNVILQGVGQPAGSLLPNWMSGYGFVFPTKADVAQARRERDQVRTIPVWTLGYDSSNVTARLLAERIALNAKDAGLSLQLKSGASADVRLVQLPLESGDPWVALAELSDINGLSMAKSSGAVEDLFAAEQALLSTGKIIPLFHLPANYGLAPSLKNCTVRSDGTLDLAGAWLEARQP
jgi:peptide/nickel transport system substrate-binding protein